jgi:hypothetical protein
MRYPHLISALKTVFAVTLISVLGSRVAFAQPTYPDPSQTYHTGSVLLDDGNGNTVLLQLPTGLTGPSSSIFEIPIQPNGAQPSGYVEQGTATGQALRWDNTLQVWYPITLTPRFPDISDAPGDNVIIDNNLVINGTLNVAGPTHLHSTLIVDGLTTLNKGVVVKEAGVTKFDITSDGIDVNGVTNLNGHLFANAAGNMIGDGNDIAQLTVRGQIGGTRNHFIVNGNTLLNGGLTLANATSFDATTPVAVTPSMNIIYVTGGTGSLLPLTITGGVDEGQTIIIVNQSTSALTFGTYTIPAAVGGQCGAMFAFDGATWTILAVK